MGPKTTLIAFKLTTDVDAGLTVVVVPLFLNVTFAPLRKLKP